MRLFPIILPVSFFFQKKELPPDSGKLANENNLNILTINYLHYGLRLEIRKKKSTMRTKSNPLIFIVEDDVIYQELVKNELEENKYSNVEVFSNGLDCVNNLYKMPDIIMVDYHLDKKMNGIQVLKRAKNFNENIHVIMFSAQEKLDVIISSIKYGAYDYVVKNEFAMRRLRRMVASICKWNELLFENYKFKKNRNRFLLGVSSFTMLVIILRYLFPRYFS